MTMRHRVRNSLFALALLPAAPALAAGFDCAKATRQIDKAICLRDTVNALDGRMAQAFEAALAAQPDDDAAASLRAGQKAWLAERDKSCALETVTPVTGSEEGLRPQELGQLLCLQAIYPPRIARLTDLAAPPLVPLKVRTVPVEPFEMAYPGDWRQAGYQALFSPDKALLALGVEDDAGYVRQVWLYEPASGRLAIASPPTHEGKTEAPDHIAGLDRWSWGEDGRFYVRARRPLGEDGVYAADMDGYALAPGLPADGAGEGAADDAEGTRPPGFDDDSYNGQQGGAFTVWAQNRGHGSFDLLAARTGDEEARVVASGGWELEDFLLDPAGTRLFYTGEDGIVVADPATGVKRRLEGTHGAPPKTEPIVLSADGEILVYSAETSCTRDAAAAETPDDGVRRVCLAYLEPAGARPTPADPWVGEWAGSGEGALTATVRRGTAKPDYLVIELATGTQGCAGAVTLYGKPEGARVLGESYDAADPSAPVCRVELSLDKGVLKAESAGPCSHYHGAACGFDGTLTRGH